MADAESMNETAAERSRMAAVLGFFGVLPGAGAALLPVLTCPACWPAYAGLLSSLGVGFVDYTPWVVPVMAAFLLISLGALAWQGIRRKVWAPFVLGTAGVLLLVVGKFVMASDPLLYGGIALLVVASVWNAWPRKVCAIPDSSCCK